MERHAEVLCRGTDGERLLATARALEAELGRRKNLSANVDYYGALVMYLLGFPREVFSSLIVASRYAGLDRTHRRTDGRQPADPPEGRVRRS